MTEITPETLSYLLNGLLTVVALVTGYLVKKYKPELDSATAQIQKLNHGNLIAVRIIAQIKGLVSTYNEATADKKITPEEAEKILREVNEIMSSPDVQKLLKEL